MKNKIAIQASNNREENRQIIKILENLGGKNNNLLIGNLRESSCYYIGENNLIECSSINYCYIHLKDYRLYTLEEYKKEFMEKEIKITVPEGYEIDKENSTFEKIVFKKTEEKLTYEDIVEKLFKYKINYFITIDGSIKKSYTGYKCPNTAPTKHQLERLLAINKLMNVAYYLNDGWEPDWTNKSEGKYRIIFNGFIFTTENNVWGTHGGVIFKSMELAEQAIEILGEETVKLALGV